MLPQDIETKIENLHEGGNGMKQLKKIVKVGSALGVTIGAGAYTCYRMVFSVPERKPDPYKGTESKEFRSYKRDIRKLLDEVTELSYEDVYTASEDGLLLHGRYYVSAPDAPVEILCHGYRSSGYRDFCGGLKMALERGHNVLLIDQRAHGESDGKCLTFGIKERKDCLAWVDYICRRCGADTKVVLVGISMGAATVTMVTELELPDNVVGVIADCGYSSPKKIIRKVMRDRGYPQCLYPFVALGARVFGHFNLNESSSEEALKSCKIPVLFIHGDGDDFVPWDMSKENYEACASDKKFVTVPTAGHAVSYLVDEEAYTQAVDEFLEKVL